MADAEVHLEIGPQYVEAAREVVEKATAPFRDLKTEWGVRDEPSGVIDEYGGGPDAEAAARALKHHRGTVVMRLVSDWKEAEADHG